MNYPRFRKIMQFSLQCPKKTIFCEQSLENDKKRGVFNYLPQLIDILRSLMSLLPSSYKTVDDNEQILILGDATLNSILNWLNKWLVDGTFRLSPEKFCQIYTIPVELLGFAPPCVYELL